MSHPLKRYNLKTARAAAPRPTGRFDPVADIVVRLNSVIGDLNDIAAQATGIYNDLGQIIGGGIPPQPPQGGGAVIAWPSYQGVATPVGVSTDGLTSIYYDASLGSQALTAAQDLLANAPAINAANATLFWAKTQATNVIVFALGGATDGSGGADHMACDYMNGSNIEVCVDFANPTWERTMYEAELSECNMGGNLCGVSTGEALSRWAAMVIAPNTQLQTFASAPVWASDGYANWVDQTFMGTPQVPGDQDYDSIGCGMAFISWLMKTHNVSFNAIATEMVHLGSGGTLTSLFNATTTIQGSPWPTFLAACHAISITTDDPFGALSTATV